MSFRDLACEHLARYKVDVLGIKEDGLFHYRGLDIPKSHILPLARRDENIVKQFRASCWRSEYSKVKLHRYFHHLNSSQALCINLFYPLIVENALGLFPQFLGIPLNPVLLPQFEKESLLEVAARRTSFDFCLTLGAKSNIFVEVKYTEDGFGRAKNDKEHQIKFRETYLPLVKKSPFLVRECQDVAFFLSHYQVLRNLIHISTTDHIVLLFPSANAVVAREAVYARDRLLTDVGRAKLHIIFLEEFVRFLEGQCMDGPLDSYYKQFRAKYLPPETATNVLSLRPPTTRKAGAE